jgi:hypothetical protein
MRSVKARAVRVLAVELLMTPGVTVIARPRPRDGCDRLLMLKIYARYELDRLESRISYLHR